jgi:hypothetical protein
MALYNNELTPQCSVSSDFVNYTSTPCSSGVITRSPIGQVTSVKFCREKNYTEPINYRFNKTTAPDCQPDRKWFSFFEFNFSVCAAHADCGACAEDTQCVWCEDTQRCTLGWMFGSKLAACPTLGWRYRQCASMFYSCFVLLTLPSGWIMDPRDLCRYHCIGSCFLVCLPLLLLQKEEDYLKGRITTFFGIK